MAVAGKHLELDAALADEARDQFLGAGLACHRQHHGRDHRHGAKNYHVLLYDHVEDLRVKVDHRGGDEQGVNEEEEAVGGRQAVVRIDIQRLPADERQTCSRRTGARAQAGVYHKDRETPCKSARTRPCRQPAATLTETRYGVRRRGAGPAATAYAGAGVRQRSTPLARPAAILLSRGRPRKPRRHPSLA